MSYDRMIQFLKYTYSRGMTWLDQAILKVSQINSGPLIILFTCLISTLHAEFFNQSQNIC